MVPPTGAIGPTGAGVPVGGTIGQILSKIDGTDYNTQWITNNPATTLNDLTDVTITTPSSGQIVSYNGSQWVNSVAPETGTSVQKGNNTMVYAMMSMEF
jgi:hypothetical protein